MGNTYCGKNCGECTHKEELDCCGCLTGPGRPLHGDCELADCCREKGHESCETCGFSGHCGTLKNRKNIPVYRLEKREVDAQKQARRSAQAPILGKWFWILFWMIVPIVVTGFLTIENVTDRIPALYVPGRILNALCVFVYGAILLRLSVIGARYRIAGVCRILATILELIAVLVLREEGDTVWRLLLTLPAAAVGAYGEYAEFNTHAEVLYDANVELSEKWHSLWKWYIGLMGAIVGSLLVTFLIPSLGVLIMLAGIIGLLVVSVKKLIYLYQTAQVFRGYAASMTGIDPIQRGD